MIVESIDNLLQIFILIICTIVSFLRALAGDKSWILLFLFYGCWLLGVLYWLFCIVFYQSTPQISVISDLSWYAAYIFLYMLIRQTAPPEKALSKKFIVWLGPLFCAAMMIFFIQFGAVVSNLIYAGLMGLLTYASLHRITEKKRYHEQCWLCVVILIICLLEYVLWTVSCFFEGNTLSNPYYWIDCILSFSFLFLLPAAKKAVVS